MLQDVNLRYQYAFGKFYQMFGGLRSSLKKYRNSTLYLDIYITEKWNAKRDALSTAYQMARYWRHVEELKDVRYFEARCYYLAGNQIIGFSISVKEAGNDLIDKLKNAAELISRPIVPVEERLVVISGLIDADIPCNLSPTVTVTYPVSCQAEQIRRIRRFLDKIRGSYSFVVAPF